jgi:glycosyltransferase involved in cell wall biosynthesis
LRVVQILGGAEDGGLEKHTIELSHALAKNNIDVSVIAHKKFKNDFKDLNFFELDLSKGRNNPFILFELYKVLKKEKFDIIHTQANKATDMVIKLKPFLDSKIISTLHSYKKNIKSFEKADFIITVSDKIGEKIKNTNRVTIYNGIKIQKIQKIDLYKKFDIQKDRFMICAIGRFAKVKRFDILIEAMKLVSEQNHLILIGDGDKNITNLANSCKNVTLAGYLSGIETQKILKSSDLCVISSGREGFSYVFAESLILSTPLISTDVADIKKFIPESSIIKSNTKDIADKIQHIGGNYKENLDLFQGAFEKAKTEFSIENMTNKTICVYRRVINGL